MRRRGFTLIELLVVIAIIGILATFAVVQFTGARDKAKLAKGMAFSQSILENTGDEAIGIWDFDECGGTTASDRSGLGNNGTLISSPVWSTDTPSGKGCSLSFDGVAQYAQVADSPSLDLGTNDFTISVWVKRAGAGAGSQFVIGKSGNGGTTDYELYLAANGMIYSRMDGVSITSSIGAVTVDGKWHQIVVTADRDGKGQVYVDGSLSGAGVDLTALDWDVTNVSVLYIARRPAAGYFNGFVDDLRLYRKALTAREVRSLYAESGMKEIAGR